jgi:hypothetical protein
MRNYISSAEKLDVGYSLIQIILSGELIAQAEAPSCDLR